ncbi:hypothetical protein [Candidatus Poriferisodalis sp.]|uniref:hypothetical protein n=1 Tax=Candidatus Poriferisodalis sp. TaxID=3101277 RepID=UPI003B0256F4
MIRSTPGVTGHAGPGGKPSPLRRREVEAFLAEPDEGSRHSDRSRHIRLRAAVGCVREGR